MTQKHPLCLRNGEISTRQDSMSIFNVRDYGAVGNGFYYEDDSAAFQAAINAALASDTTKRSVFVPPGNYIIKTTLYITGPLIFYGVPGMSTLYNATPAPGAIGSTDAEKLNSFNNMKPGQGSCIVLGASLVNGNLVSSATGAGGITIQDINIAVPSHYNFIQKIFYAAAPTSTEIGYSYTTIRITSSAIYARQFNGYIKNVQINGHALGLHIEGGTGVRVDSFVFYASYAKIFDYIPAKDGNAAILNPNSTTSRVLYIPITKSAGFYIDNYYENGVHIAAAWVVFLNQLTITGCSGPVLSAYNPRTPNVPYAGLKSGIGTVNPETGTIIPGTSGLQIASNTYLDYRLVEVPSQAYNNVYAGLYICRADGFFVTNSYFGFCAFPNVLYNTHPAGTGWFENVIAALVYYNCYFDNTALTGTTNDIPGYEGIGASVLIPTESTAVTDIIFDNCMFGAIYGIYCKSNLSIALKFTSCSFASSHSNIYVTSNNALKISVENCYFPPLFGVDITPVMISNSENYLYPLKNIVVSGSGIYGGSAYPYYYALDNNTTTMWRSAYTTISTAWWKIDFSQQKKIVGYKIYSGTSSFPLTAWVLAGSNDNSTWIDIDTKTGQNAGGTLSALFSVTNPDKYRYYKFHTFSVGGTSPDSVQIKEIKFYESEFTHIEIGNTTAAAYATLSMYINKNSFGGIYGSTSANLGYYAIKVYNSLYTNITVTNNIFSYFDTRYLYINTISTGRIIQQNNFKHYGAQLSALYDSTIGNLSVNGNLTVSGTITGSISFTSLSLTTLTVTGLSTLGQVTISGTNACLIVSTYDANYYSANLTGAIKTGFQLVSYKIANHPLTTNISTNPTLTTCFLWSIQQAPLFTSAYGIVFHHNAASFEIGASNPATNSFIAANKTFMSMDFANGTVNFPQGIKVQGSTTTDLNKILLANSSGIFVLANQSDLAVDATKLTTVVPVSKGGTGKNIWTSGGNKLLKCYSTTIEESTISDTGSTTTIGASIGLSITATTASSTTGTGALVVAGGVGIGGKLYVGDSIYLPTNKAIVASATSKTLLGYLGTEYCFAYDTGGATVIAYKSSTISIGSLATGDINIGFNLGAGSKIVLGNTVNTNEPVYIQVLAGGVRSLKRITTVWDGTRFLLVAA